MRAAYSGGFGWRQGGRDRDRSLFTGRKLSRKLLILLDNYRMPQASNRSSSTDDR
jgi:hypothetical protein